MAGSILVGTSSWADPGFVAEWYPQGMPARDRLAWYAERFDLVEVNSSFYTGPGAHALMRWGEVTPRDFTLDYKLHKLLSRHSADVESLPPELRDEAETTGRGRVKLTPELETAMVDATIEAIAPLEEAGKLGALLLQLTPAFSPRKHELDELAPLIERFAPRTVAVELRNRGWVTEERADRTFAWLSEHGAAFVAGDAPPGEEFSIMPPVDAVTRDDLAYIRIHGRNTEGYLKG